MAIDAFLYFPKTNRIEIRGETRDEEMAAHKAFQLTGFGFGATSTLSTGSISGGAGGGKTDFEPFSINKKGDTGSCALFQTLCISDHIPEAVLELRRAGGSAIGSGATYMKFHFLQVVVSNITWAGDDEGINEDVTFEYGAMKIQYSTQDKTGKMSPATGSAGEAIWSQVLNKNVYRV